MIQIIPTENKKRENEILKNLVKENDIGRVLVMTEKGKELGFVATAIRENKLILLDFSLDPVPDFINLGGEERCLLDALMRAAASYAETNGADYIETETPIFNDFMKKAGFETDENHAFGPMSLIVKYKQ